MNDNLSRLIAAFRRMDEEAQHNCVRMLEGVAAASPAKRPVRLSLVSGSAAPRTDAGRTTGLSGGAA